MCGRDHFWVVVAFLQRPIYKFTQSQSLVRPRKSLCCWLVGMDGLTAAAVDVVALVPLASLSEVCDMDIYGCRSLLGGRLRVVYQVN